ncbi:MAG: SMP-30/gluconolactonase/LRE family protein [Planctomycetota bacterium]|nr:SMP-30/gluconolactonase/LRE family protein [Planctomycetota bacterium]MDA1214025.1 SMP-30/gluconolactonase/LRE family protein [Planctomycetota bacterium]
MRRCFVVANVVFLCGIIVAKVSPLPAQDMALSQVLVDGEDWQLLGEGYKFTEGPAVDRQGHVYFTDIPNNVIYVIDTDGAIVLFAENTANTNGLMVGPDDRIYGCRNGDKQIVAYTTDGAMEVIVEGVTSNDLVVTSKGAIFFTDPSNGQVYYISPQREMRVVANEIHPNGVIMWPDEGTLVVTERDSLHLWTYRIESDGSLTNRERYYGPLQLRSDSKTPGSDGMTVDRDFRLYVTTRLGLQMFDPTGRLGGTIAKPHNGPMANACFGGKDFDYLYATCGDKVYRRKTKVTGVPYFLRAGEKKE